MWTTLVAGSVCLLSGVSAFAADPETKPKVRPKPKPVVVIHDPAAKQILDLPGTGVDESKIDYAKLPRIKGERAVICSIEPNWKFQLHNYLIHHEGQYWAMWSHGPGEDEPTQRVRFATSIDGVRWSEFQFITPPPEKNFAYIARGFWLRDGELLALVAHFKDKGAFGVDKHLKLEAYVWQPEAKLFSLPGGTGGRKSVERSTPDSKQAYQSGSDTPLTPILTPTAEERGKWVYKGVAYDNAINNFPPENSPAANG